MSFDPATLPPAVKAALIKIGEGFGSTDTLDQANQTLEALKTHGALVAQHGFGATDGQRLTDVRDLLIAGGVGRTGAVGAKKTASAGYAKALSGAEAARITARAVAEGAQSDLEEGGDEVTAAMTRP